jgi:hypothetical protein
MPDKWEEGKAPPMPTKATAVSTERVVQSTDVVERPASDPKDGPERHRPRNVGIDGNDDWKKVPGVFLPEDRPDNATVLAFNKKQRKLENDERFKKQQALKDYIDKFEGL